MKKIFSLSLALFATISANAQTIYQPGEHDNVVSVVANDATDDLTMYPLEITLSNPTTPMRGVEVTLAIDDNAVRPWVWDEDERTYAYDNNTKRIYKNTPVKLFLLNNDHPKYPSFFFVSIADERDFKLSEGTLATIYFDATQLSNGDHTIHVISPMCSYVGDDLSSASYFCANQDIHFNISGGTLTVLNGINVLSPTDSKTDTYDLQGRRIAEPTHGLYIQSGRKIIR